MHVEEEKKNYGRFINASSRHQHTIVTPGLFFVAALLEIGGGYWYCNGLGKKGVPMGLIGGIILFLYAIIPTLQPSHFGRTFATYGGIFHNFVNCMGNDSR